MQAWEDLRPKTAVAANVGAGPDIVLAWLDDPHQYPDKLLDLTSIATYLGEAYGGWFPVCETYGKVQDGRWIAMPVGAGGGTTGPDTPAGASAPGSISPEPATPILALPLTPRQPDDMCSVWVEHTSWARLFRPRER